MTPSFVQCRKASCYLEYGYLAAKIFKKFGYMGEPKFDDGDVDCMRRMNASVAFAEIIGPLDMLVDKIVGCRCKSTMNVDLIEVQSEGDMAPGARDETERMKSPTPYTDFPPKVIVHSIFDDPENNFFQ